MYSSASNSHCYVFDDVFLDCENFCVQKAGEVRSLTPRAFDVLVYLVENSGRVVEKQELFENVWQEKFVSDNALTRAIKEVRHAIGDNAELPRYIETVHKRGYRFIAPVNMDGLGGRDVPRVTAIKVPRIVNTNGNVADVLEQAAIDPSKDQGRRSPSKEWMLLTAAVVALAVIALVAIMFRNRSPLVSNKPAIKRNVQITTWTGLDMFPSLSPDRNSVAYCSDHEGSFEIYVRQITPGAKENQLTSDGQQNLEPSWSPDGKWIAYHSRSRGGIWIVPASGGIVRQLVEFGSRPAWSRDGSRIAFQSDGLSDISAASTAAPSSTLWIVSLEGGEPVQITQPANPVGGHGSPNCSPDGKRIVFVANDIAALVIWEVSPDGTGLRRITPEGRSYSDPIYSPDGKNILFVSDTVWRVPLGPDGTVLSEPEQIGNRGLAMIRNLSISADGKRVAYSLLRQIGNLWSVPLMKGSAERAGGPASFVEDTSQRKTNPLFSRDGGKVAYTAWIAGFAGSVWTVDTDGKNRAQLTTDPSTIVGWLPESNQLATISYLQDKRLLVSTAMETSRKRQIAELNLDLAFARLSPDGKSIAFNAYTGGSVNLWIYSIPDGTAKQLTFDKELLGFSAWSPDGKWIAAELKRNDDTYVALVPLDGSAPIQLNSDRGQSWTGSWSPDGDKIAFAGWRNGVWNIWWISVTTKQQKQITNYSRPNSFVRYPTWSPRGNQIVYEYAELSGNIWLAEVK